MIVHAKICGINDANAMQAAVAAGAQYVGLVFYPPSPRALNPDQAAELGIHIPDEVTTVGLFVDPDDELVDDVLAKVSLGLLQLHGSENPARCQELRARTGLPVMKAIKVTDQADIQSAQAYVDAVDFLMFDAKAPKDMKNALPGGNALSFDWTLLSGQSWSLPWMLAGGIHLDNVIEAVQASGATIVDVSSGVESEPGRKDPARIEAFLDAVKNL